MPKITKQFLSLIVIILFSASACSEENPANNTATESPSVNNTATKTPVTNDPAIKQLAVKNPIVIMHTTKGPITLELYADKAPVTVANLLNYANAGYYDDGGWVPSSFEICFSESVSLCVSECCSALPRVPADCGECIIIYHVGGCGGPDDGGFEECQCDEFDFHIWNRRGCTRCDVP